MDRVAEALKTTSYSEIARQSGTTPGFVSLLFRGQRKAKMETAGKVAKALKVSMDELHVYLSKLSKRANGWRPSNGSGYTHLDVRDTAKKKKRAKAPTAEAA